MPAQDRSLASGYQLLLAVTHAKDSFHEIYLFCHWVRVVCLSMALNTEHNAYKVHSMCCTPMAAQALQARVVSAFCSSRSMLKSNWIWLYDRIWPYDFSSLFVLPWLTPKMLPRNPTPLSRAYAAVARAARAHCPIFGNLRRSAVQTLRVASFKASLEWIWLKRSMIIIFLSEKIVNSCRHCCV